MKRLTALLLCLITVITAALALGSCAKSEVDVPSGMKICKGGAELGYYFFVPSEWTLSSSGSVYSAYVSSLDNSSVSLTEAELPDGTLDAYFKKSMSKSKFSLTYVVDGKECLFGKRQAIKYVYDYMYTERAFRTMQILIPYGDRLLLFTYTASGAERSGSGKTYYEYHTENVDKIVENFLFTDKTGEVDSKTEPTPEYDADGWRLLSDRAKAGFDFYVPADYITDRSEGLVAAHAADLSNVNLTAATATGVSIDKYWANRKEQLRDIVGEITELRVGVATTFGNAKNAFLYEYIYGHNGTVYHVYQVLAVTRFKGYVMTFTATEENYGSHTDEIIKMCEKVKF